MKSSNMFKKKNSSVVSVLINRMYIGKSTQSIHLKRDWSKNNKFISNNMLETLLKSDLYGPIYYFNKQKIILYDSATKRPLDQLKVETIEKIHSFGYHSTCNEVFRWDSTSYPSWAGCSTDRMEESNHLCIMKDDYL